MSGLTHALDKNYMLTFPVLIGRVFFLYKSVTLDETRKSVWRQNNDNSLERYDMSARVTGALIFQQH